MSILLYAARSGHFDRTPIAFSNASPLMTMITWNGLADDLQKAALPEPG
jgi:hypothetical protein